MSTEDSMRKAAENLDKAAGAAPTSESIYGNSPDDPTDHDGRTGSTEETDDEPVAEETANPTDADTSG